MTDIKNEIGQHSLRINPECPRSTLTGDSICHHQMTDELCTARPHSSEKDKRKVAIGWPWWSRKSFWYPGTFLGHHRDYILSIPFTLIARLLWQQTSRWARRFSVRSLSEMGLSANSGLWYRVSKGPEIRMINCGVSSSVDICVHHKCGSFLRDVTFYAHFYIPRQRTWQRKKLS